MGSQEDDRLALEEGLLEVGWPCSLSAFNPPFVPFYRMRDGDERFGRVFFCFFSICYGVSSATSLWIFVVL